ncbi:MAG: hypothetical protein RQ732_00140 [Methylophaga sp.]|nr:hypothetical protein [Methylophaga sp.]
MNELQRWQQENHACCSDHTYWLQEVEHWTKQNQRLVGLIYKLEHALPEYSARLDQHVARINTHDAEIKRYECGLDPRCLSDCDSYIGSDEQRRFHEKLIKSHDIMRQQHADFEAQHKVQLQQFREIALQLIEELAKD